MRKISFIFLLLFSIRFFGWAQPCTNLGQTPETAFPVCGTSVFQQSNVPICSTRDLFVPGCSGGGGANYQNKNPYWYRFTCFQGGTLGFVITPNDLNDDYDWQLYDITGLDPEDVFTNNNIIVTGNWSGSYGLTGASASGVNYIQCASAPSDNAPTFSSMPVLIQGHEYLLLVSHFTDSQSGYSLSFGGGTAVITDPTDPLMAGLEATCDATTIKIKLNKKMKCSSLAANGSDFLVSPYPGSIVSAAGGGCSNSFDMDELVLNLSTRLQPGNYTVTIRNGTDGNTLRDNCDRNIPVGDSLNIIIYPIVATPMDSLTLPTCAPSSLEVVFRKKIRCDSFFADGSEFSVTGPSTVRVTGLTATCDSNQLTDRIRILLSGPIQVGGTYSLTLSSGNDGNTLIDECGQFVPDTTLFFTLKDTVSADFTYQINYGCTSNTVSYFHSGQNQTNEWMWTFGGAGTSSQQNPTAIYSLFEPSPTTLIVSNGFCSDTLTKLITFENLLHAKFEIPSFLCPSEALTLSNQSIGNISGWLWNFDNGNISTAENPSPQFYTVRDQTYPVIIRLTVTNSFGCTDTASARLLIINNCFIAVPNAFTPNGDGLNDFLYPLNAYKAKDLAFRVYNRFGQLLFFTTNWTQRWNGQYKGKGADPGTYVWTLQYTDTDTGQKVQQKGTVLLIR